MQLLKDWKLMIIVLIITLIEISFAIPLLAVALVNGDIAMSPSMEREPVENVSIQYNGNAPSTSIKKYFMAVYI